jgi:hypothetical protein
MESLKYPTQEDVMAALAARTSDVPDYAHEALVSGSGACLDPVFCVHRL